MSDLVNRLRSKHCCVYGCHCDEAAERIEQLERELAEAREDARDFSALALELTGQLAAEKTLADDLYKFAFNRAASDSLPLANYRKARGL